jgi:GDP-L-fucose synthase
LESKAKIYVAGHSGLVGSALMRALSRNNYHNIVIRSQDELDLKDQRAVREFIDQAKPEFVFLAAARVGGIMANNTYKADFIYDNLAIATNVIEASYRMGVKKLLNLGSSCIFPKLAEQPMKESALLTGLLEPTNEPYAIAKIAAIKLCRYFNEQYGTNFISVMPTNLFGPGDNFDLEKSHVLPALVRKFHLAKLLAKRKFSAIREDVARRSIGFGFTVDQNMSDAQVEKTLSGIGVSASQVTLWGTGSPFREFLYVDDLANACVFLMQKFDAKDIGEFVNIGFGSDVTINDLASMVSSAVGFPGEIAFDSSKPDGTPRKLLDSSRINKLGWRPKTTLADGIRMEYESYISAQ